MSDAKPRVLLLSGSLWPGNDSSGANISLRAAISALSGDIDFTVFARDRAFGEPAPHPSAEPGRQGNVTFRYFPVGPLGARGLIEAIGQTPHDLLWLNGFYDREFTLPVLAARQLGRLPRKPVLLSPRGEFAAGARKLKNARKQTWLTLTRLGGLLSDVTLHATGPAERADIAAGCTWSGGIAEAPNVRGMIEADATPHTGPLRLAFLGRIARVKNLHLALDVLSAVSAPVSFTIVGPVSDPDYWLECQAKITALPGHVSVHHAGEIGQEAIPALFAANDLLFLPTAGENFGHAIFEALACGVPVLISDRTPWRNLAKTHAGWELPLDDLQAFATQIDLYAALSWQEREPWRRGARAKALEWLAKNDGATAHLEMIRRLTAGSVR